MGRTLEKSFETREQALELARKLRRRRMIGATFNIYYTKSKGWRLSVEWRRK